MMKEGDAQKLKPVANISALENIWGAEKDFVTHLMSSVYDGTCP